MNKVLFKEKCLLKTGKLNSNEYNDNGLYPFFTCDPQTLRINNYAFDQKAILLAGNNASGKFNIKYYEGKFNAYQRTYIIEPKDSDLDIRFLYYYLYTKLPEFTNLSVGSATKYLTKTILENIPLTIPTIPEQKHIVDIIAKEVSYAKI